MYDVTYEEILESPSSRRAWIEISWIVLVTNHPRVALLAEGVDRNNINGENNAGSGVSPSSRRAWIEMEQAPNIIQAIAVALLAEGVDRNPKVRTDRQKRMPSPSSRRAWIEILSCWNYGTPRQRVALLAEGVDRNLTMTAWHGTPKRVALLAEGVDRNFQHPCRAVCSRRSPSSRRAWIEIE